MHRAAASARSLLGGHVDIIDAGRRVLRMNAAINSAVARPAVNSRLRTMGYEPHQMPLAETGPFLTGSIETWRKMILATGMTIN